MRYFIEYLFALPVLWLLEVLPISACFWLARRSGDFMYLFFHRRRRIAFENFERAFKGSKNLEKKKQIIRGSFQNAALSMVELFMVRRIRKDAKERFRVKDREHMDEIFRKHRGVVAAVSHLGSWEYLAFTPYLTGTSWAVIVKSVKNPYLNKHIHMLRSSTMTRPIEKKDSIRPVLKELKRGNGLAILIDQWAGPEGIWVDFFGEPTSTTSIPARLSFKMHCGVVFFFCLRTGVGKYEIQFHYVDTRDIMHENYQEILTLRLNGILEELILKYPDQWTWLHRRWKPKPKISRQS